MRKIMTKLIAGALIFSLSIDPGMAAASAHKIAPRADVFGAQALSLPNAGALYFQSNQPRKVIIAILLAAAALSSWGSRLQAAPATPQESAGMATRLEQRGFTRLEAEIIISEQDLLAQRVKPRAEAEETSRLAHEATYRKRWLDMLGHSPLYILLSLSGLWGLLTFCRIVLTVTQPTFHNRRIRWLGFFVATALFQVSLLAFYFLPVNTDAYVDPMNENIFLDNQAKLARRRDGYSFAAIVAHETAHRIFSTAGFRGEYPAYTAQFVRMLERGESIPARAPAEARQTAEKLWALAQKGGDPEIAWRIIRQMFVEVKTVDEGKSSQGVEGASLKSVIEWIYSKRRLDAFTYYSGPYMVDAHANPYSPESFRALFERGAFKDIAHIPLQEPGEFHPYIAAPINLLLYAPFHWIRDYGTYLTAYLAVYLSALAAAMYPWIRRMTKSRAIGVLGPLVALPLLFSISPAFQFSLGAGQIDYLYIGPLSLGIYLFARYRESGDKRFAAGAGALLMLAAFVKVFPAMIPIALGISWLLGRGSSASRPSRADRTAVVLSLAAAAAAYFGMTGLYPGVQAWPDWIAILGRFKAGYGSGFLRNFISVLMRESPASGYVYGLVYAVAVGAVWKFLFGRKEDLNELHLAGLVALVPTFMPFLEHYYYTVMVVPFFVALQQIGRTRATRRQQAALYIALGVIFLLTQASSGSGVLGYFDVRLPDFLYDPNPFSQMARLSQFLLYPSSVMLWGIIGLIQKLSRPPSEGPRRLLNPTHEDPRLSPPGRATLPNAVIQAAA